jgi:hypothetical protein
VAGHVIKKGLFQLMVLQAEKFKNKAGEFAQFLVRT